MHFEQFHGRDFVEAEPPGVVLAQVHLLQVLIEESLGKEVPPGGEVAGQQRDL